MFSLPEVDRKFEQKKVFKIKTRQIAGAILGWIDAASMGRWAAQVC